MPGKFLLVYVTSEISNLISFFMAIFRDDKRAIYDLIGGTYVSYTQLVISWMPDNVIFLDVLACSTFDLICHNRMCLQYKLLRLNHNRLSLGE